jgi:hypothetical protein
MPTSVEGRATGRGRTPGAAAWAKAVVEAVRSSTASQGLPELLEDASVVHRVASVFGMPLRGDDDAAA